MLQIVNLRKRSLHSNIHDLNIVIQSGEIVNIECSEEASQSLYNLILGKDTPSSGEILIHGVDPTSYIKDHLPSVGLVTNLDQFYERFSISEYVAFFNDLLATRKNYKTILMKLGLLDISDIKVKDLSYSQRKRLSFAREQLKDLKLLLIQDPLRNLDKDAARVMLENIHELKDSGVAILNMTTSLKDCILIGGRTFILDEEGVEEIQPESTFEPVNSSKDAKNESERKEHVFSEKPLYKVDRIPAKMDERILLFNPKEIDFIESEQSVSYLNVRGERFVCPFTLNELEERLKFLGFFRTHRSYLVNLQRVRELVVWTRNSYSLILEDKNKSTIPLSKGRIDELKEILKL